MTYHIRKITLLCILAFTTNSIWAGNVTTTPKSTATLASSCIISVTDINFGEINKIGANKSPASPAYISLTCSNKLAYKITLNIGAHPIGNQPGLVGTVSGEQIYYAICKYSYSAGISNSTCGPDTTGWLNPISNPAHGFLTGTGNGQEQTIPLYGFANPGYYTPDTYSDTLTATITY